MADGMSPLKFNSDVVDKTDQSWQGPATRDPASQTANLATLTLWGCQPHTQKHGSTDREGVALVIAGWELKPVETLSGQP